MTIYIQIAAQDSLLLLENKVVEEGNILTSVPLITLSAVVFTGSILMLHWLRKRESFITLCTFFILIAFAAWVFAAMSCTWLSVVEAVIVCLLLLPLDGDGNGEAAEAFVRDVHEN